MVVISFGMPKSASTFVFQLTQLLVNQCGSNQNLIRNSLLPEHLRSSFYDLNYGMVQEMAASVPSDRILVVKTHTPLRNLGDIFGLGDVRATVSVRDPRDAILSAIETGERERRNPAGRQAFATFRTVANTLPAYRRHCANALEWWNAPGVVRVRYREVVETPLEVAARISDRLDIQPDLARAVDWLTEDKSRIVEFSTGKVGRHSQAFTPEENALMQDALSAYIEEFS